MGENDIWGLNNNVFYPAYGRFGVNNRININVKEYGDKFDVTIDVPGLKMDEVSLTYDTFRDTMTIKTQKVVERESTSDVEPVVHFFECFEGAASRTIQFTYGIVDRGGIRAKWDAGQLKVTVPKQDAPLVDCNGKNILIE